MKPADKAPEITEFLDGFARSIYGISRQDAIRSNTCLNCRGEAVEFRSEKCRTEYTLSGMCQECQDDFFGG